MTRLNEPELSAALMRVAEVMAHAGDDWWIIGSAAVALHLREGELRGDSGQIADIDVITSRRDLDALYNALPLTNSPEEGKPMFLSEKFGRWSEPPLHVEFMAGLKVREADDWIPIRPTTRAAIVFGRHTLYVPERQELIAILKRFGREKDLRRAASLS